MSLNILAMAVAEGYTDGALSGVTAIQGKNCTISSITKTNGVTTVTFAWEMDDGTKKTQDMIVNDGTNGTNGTDGAKGDTGLGIDSVSINASNHLIVKFTDNTVHDAGLMPSIELALSEQTGNQLQKKDDGYFVPKIDLTNYVQKDGTKVLSTNDYTDADKTAVGTIANKVDKVTGKGLSTNDYDATEKAEVAKIKDKLDSNKVVTSFSTTTLDTNVPSEKLVKDSLDDKADKSVIDYNVDNGFLKSHNLVDNSLNVRGYYYKVGGIQEDSHKAMTSAIKVEQGKTYVCSIFDNSGNRINKAVYTSFANANDTSAIAQYVSDTFVPKSGENYVRIRNYDTENAYIVNNDYKYQLEEGTEASTNYYDYAKSNIELTKIVNDDLKMLGYTVPNECPIQNYTDSNGVFHQRVGRVDLGSLAWGYDSSKPRFYTADLYTLAKKASSASEKANAYCIKYTNSSENVVSLTDKTIGIGQSGGLYVHDTSYTDATTFKSAMNGVYLYYELATEVTKSVDGNEKLANKSITDFNVVSDNVKSGHKINVYKTGNIVFVNFDFKTEIDITAWTNKYFVTNMPKPLHSIYFMDASDHKFNINTNGVFQLANGTASADTELYGCITYFSVE